MKFGSIALNDIHHPQNDPAKYVQKKAPLVLKELRTIFDSIDWGNKGALLSAAFRNDDVVPEFITRVYSYDNTREQTKAIFISYLRFCEDNSPQALGSQIRERLGVLEKYFDSKPESMESKLDLKQAIDSLAEVVLYMQSLDPQNDRVAIEDCCVKLAIEGTNCHGRAVRFHAKTILEDLKNPRYQLSQYF